MTKKPNQYLRGLEEHFLLRRRDPRYTDKRNTAVNDCFRPSNESSKADLAEYHREEIGIRKARRWAREGYSASLWYQRYGEPHDRNSAREMARRVRQAAARQ